METSKHEHFLKMFSKFSKETANVVSDRHWNIK